VAAPSPTPVELELRRLGSALSGRIEDVLAGTIARIPESASAQQVPVRDSLDQACRASTIAVAHWMAGCGPQARMEAGREVWSIFGRLAAEHIAPLHEVTKHCLRWRDSAADVLRYGATQTGASPEALFQALDMLRFVADITLVRMCEFFETKHRRMDDELARHQEELAFVATHDELTGLPNRAMIMDRCEQMLLRARRYDTQVAALFINLDNFKNINDTLNRAAGDELLQAVTARLDCVVRATDVLGRLDRDDFVVLAEELSPTAGPELIAERLLEALKEPFRLAGSQDARLTVTAGIGIAMGERASAEELLRDANIAMHQAKWTGKDRYALFEPGMQDSIRDLLALEMELRDAVENDEFFLVYQPTFDLRDLSPTGMEALIRWNSAARGVVQPNDFIPLLEETGLIIDVGRWVLRAACRQGATWRKAGHPIGVAVNVSGRQLDTDEFVTDVREALTESGLDVGALTLEITETSLMQNTEVTARWLTAIKALGVRVAIDDFGTGYSSLAHLQRFPVDALKIDRQFISRLTQSPVGEAVIRTLVQLGKALSIETLAEGIEQEQELSLLRLEQCDSGQGFLFARPLDAGAADAFLQGWANDRTPSLTRRRRRSDRRGGAGR
jgi:diguanylate cyclase (GGDEF)-like protein